MDVINTILVDDEPDTLKTLQLLIKKYCPEINVLGAYNNPEQALPEIEKLNPDLLFLDIQMPGMSGFELLENLTKYSGSVVFVTAHNTHGIKAIKFSALDYLLKPVAVVELQQSVAKYKKQRAGKPDMQVLQQLVKNIEFLSSPAPTKFSVSTQEGIEVIVMAEIDYLKADRNYTLIKRKSKKDLLVSKPLKDFEGILTASTFLRVHSSYLVNMQKVERYVRSDGGYAVMEDGTKITVSRSHKEDFLRYLKS